MSDDEKPGKLWRTSQTRLDSNGTPTTTTTTTPPVSPEITDDRLAEIERLANAATEGPWISDSHEIYGAYGNGPEFWNRRMAEDGEFVWIGETCALGAADDANASFIAASRSAVPELLDEVRRLRQQVEQVRPVASEIVALMAYFGDHGGGERQCEAVEPCPCCDANSLAADLRRALGSSHG